MPDTEPIRLRLICICGQKMKVSPEMYGRPGKCVACGQKIRIPSKKDIEPETYEISLVDHPEYIRKPSKGKSRKERPAQNVALSYAGAVPLDIFEPLRVLVSLEHKIKLEQQRLRRAKGRKEAETRDKSRDSLAEGLERLHQQRESLDEEIRQKLMETAIELASTHEKIAQSGLAARVGETAFDDYRDRVEKLRRRRDALERREQNLRGWICVRDPYLAGGYIDVPYEKAHAKAPRLTLAPSEIEDASSMLEWHLQALREALARREKADAKLGEIDRLREEKDSAAHHAVARAAARGDRKRAAAAVAFAQNRIQQVRKDAQYDAQVVDTQLDRLRSRLAAGEINSHQFNEQEQRFLRMKSDYVRAQDLMERALSANTAYDVPTTGGTFIGRLGMLERPRRLGPDSWIGWLAAALLFIAIFLPTTGSLSPLAAYWSMRDQSRLIAWLVLTPALLSLAIAAIGFAPWVAARGIGYCLCALLIALLALTGAHEAGYGVSALDALARPESHWFEHRAFLAAGCAGGLLTVAAFLGALQSWAVRIALPATLLVGSLAGAAVMTDFGGLIAPSPHVLPPSNHLVAGPRPVYETILTVANEGRRSLVLNGARQSKMNFAFVLERRAAQTGDMTAVQPIAVITGQRTIPVDDKFPELLLDPGDSVQLHYVLDPGNYEARLSNTLVREFALEMPAPEPTPDPMAPLIAAGRELPVLEPGSGAGAKRAGYEATVEGIVVAEGKKPQFSIRVFSLKDGPEEEKVLTLESELADGWKIEEFNPAEQTITLVKNGARLILRAQERTPLQAPNPS